jgi:hypothetical protein
MENKLFEISNIKDTIITIKQFIKHNSNNITQFNIENIFPTFVQQYPFLFKAIINNYDDILLNKMISSIEDVILGNKSFESVRYEIDKDLANKFNLT